MNKPAAAVILAAAATVAPAQMSLVELLPGYTLGQFHGLSADGSTLAVDMFIQDSIGYDAYGWRNDAWESLPRHNQFNHWQGISADGRTTLSESSNWGSNSRLVLVTDGVRKDIDYSHNTQRRTLGALTRDAGTVFYSKHQNGSGSDPDADRTVELFRYQAGGLLGQRIGALPDRYTMVHNLIAGSRDDFFVINAQSSGSITEPGRGRTLIYNTGELIELADLPGTDLGTFRADAMTPDGSVIIGTQTELLGARHISWIYRDGTLSELTVAGFSRFSASSITDDAFAMVGYGTTDAGESSSFLIYEDGRAFSLETLFAMNGFTLETGEQASMYHISGDGSTIAGSIYRGAFSPFGPDFALFTITIPAPAGLLPLAGLFAIFRRRR